MADLAPILQAPLIQASGTLWKQATQAPFLEAVARGDVPAGAFTRWLSQDYLFASGLTAFQAIVLSKAPRSCHSPLIAGLVALDSELGWFEAHAGRLRLDLNVEPHPVCQHYNDFLLRSAHTEPYEVLLAALFGVEVSYLAAWSAFEPAGPYAEFIERWSNPGFVEYVGALENLAEQNPHPQQQASFDSVLELERDFWRMAWEG